MELPQDCWQKRSLYYMQPHFDWEWNLYTGSLLSMNPSLPSHAPLLPTFSISCDCDFSCPDRNWPPLCTKSTQQSARKVAIQQHCPSGRLYRSISGSLTGWCTAIKSRYFVNNIWITTAVAVWHTRSLHQSGLVRQVLRFAATNSTKEAWKETCEIKCRWLFSNALLLPCL